MLRRRLQLTLQLCPSMHSSRLEASDEPPGRTDAISCRFDDSDLASTQTPRFFLERLEEGYQHRRNQRGTVCHRASSILPDNTVQVAQYTRHHRQRRRNSSDQLGTGLHTSMKSKRCAPRHQDIQTLTSWTMWSHQERLTLPETHLLRLALQVYTTNARIEAVIHT